MTINSSTSLYGLIGYPVKHSLSPLMHNAAFKALGIDAEYRLFEVKPEELNGFLFGSISVKDTEGKSFLSKDIIGFNITIPHKVRALEYLIKNTTVRSDFSVAGPGAVNTVKRGSDKLYYHNTDVEGFTKALIEDLKFDTKNKNVFVFGGGGAGRAVVTALSTEGMEVEKIYIYDINKETMKSIEKHFSKFDEVKDKLECLSREEIAEKIRDSNLLVNASPVGMKEGDPSVIEDKKLLHKDLYVYDVVYNRKTQLVKDAKSLDLPARGGLEMLLYQGVAAFELWKPEKKPLSDEVIDKMRQALNKGLEEIKIK